MSLTEEDKQWITERLEQVAAEMRQGFHKWGSPVEMRQRSMADDEMKAEYDFTKGVRGKHFVPPDAVIHLPGSIRLKYAIVIEKVPNSNYSAYVLDLPGCVAAAVTLEETKQLMQGAIEMHLAGMREDGDPIPEPTTLVDYVEVTDKK